LIHCMSWRAQRPSWEARECLANTVIDTGELRAHRALDDCVALRQVVHSVAYRLGCSVTDLLRPFSVQWDEQASMAQVAALIEE
jgi:hypothetical protein